MKKNFVFLIITVFTLSIISIPSMANAKTSITGLKEVIEEEVNLFGQSDNYKDQIEELKNADLSNYTDDKDKVNVYLFRGSSCSHCFDAVVFFAGLAKEYGDKFNLVSYEVWGNKDNSELMEKTAEKMNDEVGGVPYIIVGKKSWNGYTDSYGDEIKKEIDKEYKLDVKKRNDIMNVKEEKSNDLASLLIILLITGVIAAGIIVTRKKA